MSRAIGLRLALVVVLVATAVLGRSPAIPGLLVGALLAFGVFNVWVEAPGTRVVRAVGYLLTLLALARPIGTARPVLLLVVCFGYPPAFLIAWARNTVADRHSDVASQPAFAQTGTAAIIIAVAVASMAYRSIGGADLQQSSVLFVGIPALLALVVVYTAMPTTPGGIAVKAVTIGLLISLTFLWEGALCVLMAAPLFYVVALVVAAAAKLARARDEEQQRPFYSTLLVLMLVPVTLEGVTNFYSLDREERVSASRIVDARAGDVRQALFAAPRFERLRALPLRAGFPWPTASRIEQAGDRQRWIISIRGGEMFLNGMEPRTGDLVLEVDAAGDGLVRWRAVEDTSHMTHFLTWRASEVRWEPVDADHTRVTWTLEYRRGLDPAWYFGPWERYVSRLAADALIDMVATP